MFCFGGVGKAGRLDRVGMTAHTAWTPWLCPHAWGLYRRMGAFRHAKGRACTRGVWAGPVSFLDGMRRADVVSGRGRKTISRHADFAALPACAGALPSNDCSPACERPLFHGGRGVCCLAGREDQFPPRDHRGYARMRGALPTNGRSPAREGPCLHEGGAFGRGWKGSSHRLDTVATPACVGALPSNGCSPACERPRFHEGGAFGRDGKGGPAFLSGRAILSEVSIGSCGGRGLSERGREWGFGGRIRTRSGVGACRQ